MDKKEIAFKILSENGLKYTEPRKILIEFLSEDENKHLTPEEIYDKLNPDYPNLGIATVYRNLQNFENLGIVQRLNLGDGVSRFELAELVEDVHQHHHLVCINCDKLIEVKGDLLGELEEKIENLYDFKIIDHDLKFYGYCGECEEKKDR